MLQLIKRILGWFDRGTVDLLLLACILLLTWGILAPVGTLVWWLQQDPANLGLSKHHLPNLPVGSSSAEANPTQAIDCYIVFLTGVGDFSADQLTPEETLFLDGLVKLHPDCVAVRDVFPYSADNKGLGAERWFAPVWKLVEKADGWLDSVDVLIKIRNLWRFAISLDDRYGSVYNRGIASAIVDRMNAAHPIGRDRQQPLKIILIGTSGGAQVALGATYYLHQWLSNTDLIIVSVGGVFAGTDGFNEAEHVYHLRGREDWIEDIGSIVFPSRWAIVVKSPFNKARQQGRYTAKDSGPQAHDGPKGYFGADPAPGTDKTYVEITLQNVNQLPIWKEQTR